MITKRSGPKGIAAIESKPIESETETAAVGLTGVLVWVLVAALSTNLKHREDALGLQTPPQSDLDLTNPDSPRREGSSPPFVSRLDPPDDLLAEPWRGLMGKRSEKGEQMEGLSLPHKLLDPMAKADFLWWILGEGRGAWIEYHNLSKQFRRLPPSFRDDELISWSFRTRYFKTWPVRNRSLTVLK